MADIFISYSSRDRQLAVTLARDLQAQGFSVWWDFNLVGGASFRQQILEHLNAAYAVIVIWTNNSVASEFVLDEADHAHREKKLIPLRAEGLDISAIPIGFRQIQTIPLSDQERLFQALNNLKVSPSQTEDGQEATFASLCRRLVPLMDENGRMFRDFGPNSGRELEPGKIKVVRHDLGLWWAMRCEIVRTNGVIRGLIRDHIRLVPKKHRQLFERWLSHIDAFELHVKDDFHRLQRTYLSNRGTKGGNNERKCEARLRVGLQRP